MIPCSKPSITDLEIRYVDDAMRNGWGKHCYDYINRFEKAFCEYLGVKHAIATSSCTGALHVGICALCPMMEHELTFSMSEINWIAAVSAIYNTYNYIDFIDIEKDSWCINPSKIKKYDHRFRVDVVIATHIYGNLCNISKLQKVSNKYKILLIEDAAEALGSKINGRFAGTFGEFGVFSFHGTKVMTTGEGGMFVTNNTELYERALTISNHGRTKYEKKYFYPHEIGLKYKMSNIQAALGLAQLERLDELVMRKRQIMDIYRELFCSVSDLIEMNIEREGEYNSYWMPTVVFSRELGLKKEVVLDVLKKEGIEARPFFYPLSSLPMFSTKEDNVVAYDISSRAINLPSFHDITLGEQKTVAKVVKNIIKENNHERIP